MHGIAPFLIRKAHWRNFPPQPIALGPILFRESHLFLIRLISFSRRKIPSQRNRILPIVTKRTYLRDHPLTKRCPNGISLTTVETRLDWPHKKPGSLSKTIVQGTVEKESGRELHHSPYKWSATHNSLFCSDEGLTLETSAFNLFTMANLPYQLSW